MSHSVTVTRTTTTTTTSAILINTGYLKALPGILKLAQLVIGAVVVGLVASSSARYTSYYTASEELFLLIVSSACLIATFCLLLSCLISISTASIIAKTIFEVIYHGVAFLLLLLSSILALVEFSGRNNRQRNYEIQLAAALLVLLTLLTVMLALSAVLNLSNVIARNYGYTIYEANYGTRINFSVLALINAGLYLLSTIFAFKSYRGG